MTRPVGGQLRYGSTGKPASCVWCQLEREFKLLASGQKNLARTLRHLAHDHATEPAVAASEVEPVFSAVN